MFTGIIEEIGQIATIERGSKSAKLTISAKKILEDIYYAESSNRKVILCLAQEKIIFYGKISRLEEELPNQFFRIHKGYLINMKYVERYSRAEVRMKNGDTLLISKYKYQEFVKVGAAYIVNLEHVKSLNAQEIKIDNGDAVHLPRGAYQVLREQYFDFYCTDQ